MENPIKNNRIINDITFARRLINHLDQTNANCGIGEEEIEYLKRVANKLLKWQIETCPKEEQSYHINCDNNINF